MMKISLWILASALSIGARIFPSLNGDTDSKSIEQPSDLGKIGPVLLREESGRVENKSNDDKLNAQGFHDRVSGGHGHSWQDIFSIDSLGNLQSSAAKNKGSKVLTQNFDFTVTDHGFPDHQLRIKSTPLDLGIDWVKQYTGYLDVEDEDKHFFYWFFESKNDPENDPIILWLNGGPGCSSMTGLFFELGPSRINSKLQPEPNAFSWNKNASIIFLDQPVNVGFSYSPSSVTNTAAAAKDVYAFLELFFKQFPEYKHLDFHLAGESYAGRYIPLFASEILHHPERSFNLSSVLIGNGLTDPLTQYQHYQPMACGQGGEPAVLAPDVCESMKSHITNCTSLISTCYDSGSVFDCVPANIYCENSQRKPYHETGRNPYDIRQDCKGSNLCYEELSYIDEYLNRPEVRGKLGVEVDEFQSCNDDLLNSFVYAGDRMKPSYLSVIELLEAGIPVLIYAGDKDFNCNWLGNRAWTNKLEWSGQKDFENSLVMQWAVEGKQAGELKNFRHFTFLRIFDAGHMVPYDQPKLSLEMLDKWLSGSFAL